MTAHFTGGCLCRAVRYECTGESMMAGHCHCIDCRKTSGTGHRSHMMVPKDSVKLRGRVTVYDAPADSGNIVSRAFCPTCGTQIYSDNSGMTALRALNAASLDDPNLFMPQMSVFASRAPKWDAPNTALPSFPTMPQGVGAG